MRDIVLALTTVSADFDPGPLATDLVTRGLAACVTILPAARSIYKWDGAICDSGEQQLVIKTTADRVGALWAALKAQHPYDTAEFLVLPISQGNPDYLEWVRYCVPPEENEPSGEGVP